MLSVRFSMQPGLVLHLAAPEAEAHLVATNLAIGRPDPLADLMQALIDLASGYSDVSCRWPSEPGGAFLDFSRTSDSECGITVHSFANPDWLAGSDWLPERGDVLFGARLELRETVTAFTSALEDFGSDYREEFDRRWPWPFPEPKLSRLAAIES